MGFHINKRMQVCIYVTGKVRKKVSDDDDATDSDDQKLLMCKIKAEKND